MVTTVLVADAISVKREGSLRDCKLETKQDTDGLIVPPDFSQQEALLEDLRTDIPVHFNFLFSDSHVEVISGKQEGKHNGRPAYQIESHSDQNVKIIRC